MPARPAARPARRWPYAGVVLAILVVVVLLAVGALVASLRGSGEGPEPDAEPEHRGRLLEATPFTAGLQPWMQGWRIRYATTDRAGRPAEATGVVLAARDRPDGPRPVLAVAHGTSGIQQACAPSLQEGAFPVLPPRPATDLLAEGWVVVQSDYLGLGLPGPDGVHPYLDGPSEAHAVLDAVIAAAPVEGLELSPKTVLYGASQGGHAALFAGALADDYAPGLEVLGVAAAAPATDFSFVVRQRRPDLATLVVSSFLAVSWDRIHPDAHVREHVSDFAAAERVARHCSDEAALEARQVAEAAPLLQPSALSGRLGEIFRSQVPTARIDAPVLVGQGLADPVVPAPMQERWVSERCAAGQPLDFRTYPGLTHQTIVAPESPFADVLVGWISDRLAERKPTPTC